MGPNFTEKSAICTSYGLLASCNAFWLISTVATSRKFREIIINTILGIYLDDLLIAPKTWEEHLDHIAEVLMRFATSWILCEGEEIEFLGNVLNAEGVQMNEERNHIN